MNIDQIKKEFPIFDEKIQNNDLVYLDSANSSQKPKIVVDRINEFYTKQFSNVGRSVHYLAVAATNLYENTRSSVQKYINAKDKNEIVFTKGATEALNLVANTLGQSYLQEGDEVLITELEHHSNYDDDGVAIRAGHHCCQILHDKLEFPASARASIGVYNSKEDIDVLCESINKCKKVFQI